MRPAIQAGPARADSSQPAPRQTLLVPNATSNAAESRRSGLRRSEGWPERWTIRGLPMQPVWSRRRCARGSARSSPADQLAHAAGASRWRSARCARPGAPGATSWQEGSSGARHGRFRDVGRRLQRLDEAGRRPAQGNVVGVEHVLREPAPPLSDAGGPTAVAWLRVLSEDVIGAGAPARRGRVRRGRLPTRRPAVGDAWRLAPIL
jgi:hypothetical protein